MLRRSPITLVLVLAVIAVISYYWKPGAASITAFSPHSDQQSLTKTYLVNTRSWAYDERGSLTNIITADNARHYAGAEESLLDSPRLYSHNGDNRTWSAVSKRGRLNHSTQLLTLEGDVILTNDQNGAQLETQAMAVNLASKVAVSEVQVTVSQGLNTTRADGMIADLNNEKITMAPNVESIYVQPKP